MRHSLHHLNELVGKIFISDRMMYRYVDVEASRKYYYHTTTCCSLVWRSWSRTVNCVMLPRTSVRQQSRTLYVVDSEAFFLWCAAASLEFNDMNVSSAMSWMVGHFGLHLASMTSNIFECSCIFCHRYDSGMGFMGLLWMEFLVACFLSPSSSSFLRGREKKNSIKRVRNEEETVCMRN